MKQRTFIYFEIVGVALLITFAIFWMAFQWTECRDMGFSFWYCIQHIA